MAQKAASQTVWIRKKVKLTQDKTNDNRASSDAKLGREAQVHLPCEWSCVPYRKLQLGFVNFQYEVMSLKICGT